MATATGYIKHGSADGKVHLLRPGDPIPEDAMDSLIGADWAVDEAPEAEPGEVFEIAPGISVASDSKAQAEEGFREAVESIRKKPTNATSLEFTAGSPGDDTAFQISSNQKAVEGKHRIMVERIKKAERDGKPVGMAVAGVDVPKPSPSSAPAGFRQRAQARKAGPAPKAAPAGSGGAPQGQTGQAGQQQAPRPNPQAVHQATGGTKPGQGASLIPDDKK